MNAGEACEHGYMQARDCGSCIQTLLHEAEDAVLEARAKNRDLNRRGQKAEARSAHMDRRYWSVKNELESMRLAYEAALLQRAFADSHAKGLELELKKFKKGHYAAS